MEPREVAKHPLGKLFLLTRLVLYMNQEAGLFYLEFGFDQEVFFSFLAVCGDICDNLFVEELQRDCI